MTNRPAVAALGFLLVVVASLCGVVAWTAAPLRVVRRSLAAPDADAPLQLHWVRQLPAALPAWPEQPKLVFDLAPRPVAHGNIVLIGSTRTDSLTALDIETGAELWRFCTNGPVRLAPAVWQDRVYCASDDGFLYCLDVNTGGLVWKFRGGPSERRILGNDRLISTWPARGGPVVADGTVYFAAGVWPFMGIFLHALDAETGAVVWTNDGDGSTYMPQPHHADSFAGIAPQGQLVVAGDRLIVPGGRSVPACYDRATGKQLHFRLADSRGGGSEVLARGKVYLNGGAAYDVETGQSIGTAAEPNALSDDALYCINSGEVQAFSLASIASGKTTDYYSQPSWTLQRRYPLSMAKPTALCATAQQLFVGGKGQVQALAVQPTDAAAAWQAEIQGTPINLVAADGRLYVATLEGRLYCFGPGGSVLQKYSAPPVEPPAADEWTAQASEILKTTAVRAGWCVVWGAGDGRLVPELVRQSELRIVVIEPDAEQADRLRQQLRAKSVLPERAAVIASTPENAKLPPYFASLIVVTDFADAGVTDRQAFLPTLYQSLRPYGGAAYLPLNADDDCLNADRLAALPQAKLIDDVGPFARLIREGPLPGAGDWTHEHADAANTRVGQDRIVRAPLGVLWFGGPTHDGLLPRHGHGPQPQVIDGRAVVMGMDLIRAIDIYTGRLLWETSLPGVGKDFDETWHQAGANGSGSNYVSTRDGVYVVHQNRCLRIDLATGKILSELALPTIRGAAGPLTWGYLNVIDDYVIGGANRPREARRRGDTVASSDYLFVLDRRTGKLRWSAAAQSGFRHNAICAGGGRVFAIDRFTSAYPWRRDGNERPARLIAFDLPSGQERWSSNADIFGTWLSFSADRNILVESGTTARDTLTDEAQGMRAWHAGLGAPLWHQPRYAGPAMLRGDLVLKDRSACDLRTGAPHLRTDPITGEYSEWTWTRDYGCNTPLAAQHLLTFRSGAAGFFDLANDGGTGNFGGFRSGCTNNLIVAGGLVVAPDYTRTCTCSYQNQTSLALVPMADAEMWTYFGAQEVNGVVRRVGVSFGSPGNRKAADGTLWLEHPTAGGPSPKLPVVTTPFKPSCFRRHASWVQEGKLPWVAASGARGLTSAVVTLAPDPGFGTPDPRASQSRRYTVRLHFIEPDGLLPGERRFDVTLQGQQVLSELDIAQEAGGPARALVKEFRGVQVKKDLTVTLTPGAGAKTGSPVLCGIEVVAEGW